MSLPEGFPSLQIPTMLEIISELSHWIEGFSNSEWVIAALVLVAFTESVISPFPPDPILVAASIFNPEMALVFAAIVTVSSVAGATTGHLLGKWLGRPLLDRFVSENNVERVENLFEKYGAWAIVFAAVTPVPYKVFAITAGAMDMSLKPFIFASLLGRGVRMFLWAVLAVLFGEAALELLETRGLQLGLAFGAVVIAAFALYLLYAHIRRRRKAAAR